MSLCSKSMNSNLRHSSNKTNRKPTPRERNRTPWDSQGQSRLTITETPHDANRPRAPPTPYYQLPKIDICTRVPRLIHLCLLWTRLIDVQGLEKLQEEDMQEMACKNIYRLFSRTVESTQLQTIYLYRASRLFVSPGDGTATGQGNIN